MRASKAITVTAPPSRKDYVDAIVGFLDKCTENNGEANAMIKNSKANSDDLVSLKMNLQAGIESVKNMESLLTPECKALLSQGKPCPLFAEYDCKVESRVGNGDMIVGEFIRNIDPDDAKGSPKALISEIFTKSINIVSSVESVTTCVGPEEVVKKFYTGHIKEAVEEMAEGLESPQWFEHFKIEYKKAPRGVKGGIVSPYTASRIVLDHCNSLLENWGEGRQTADQKAEAIVSSPIENELYSFMHYKGMTSNAEVYNAFAEGEGDLTRIKASLEAIEKPVIGSFLNLLLLRYITWTLDEMIQAQLRSSHEDHLKRVYQQWMNTNQVKALLANSALPLLASLLKEENKHALEKAFYAKKGRFEGLLPMIMRISEDEGQRVASASDLFSEDLSFILPSQLESKGIDLNLNEGKESIQALTIAENLFTHSASLDASEGDLDTRINGWIQTAIPPSL